MKRQRGYLIVAPWEVAEHGGVDGVIVHLIDEMLRTGDYSPILMQNSWRDRKPRWGHKFGAFAVWVRLRSPLPLKMKFLVNRVTVAFCFTIPFAMLRLSRLLAVRHVTVINIHFPSIDSAIFILMRHFRLFRGQIILSFHGSDVRAGLRLRGLERRLWEWILRKANRIVAVSGALAQTLIEEVPSLSAKMAIAYNGVDLDMFEKDAIGHLSVVKPPRAPRIILTIASWDWYKGLDILLLAFSKLRQSNHAVTLIIVGHAGDQDEDLKALAGTLDLDPYVEWHRNVPHSEIPRFMSMADIFVLPSRTEGFPLTLLEAGASALPVVATVVGGIPELIDDQIDGLLVPPDDCDALLEAMRRLLSDSIAATAMARSLHQKVCGRFSWRAMYEAYISCIDTASLDR